jgi:hypothetical protein
MLSVGINVLLFAPLAASVLGQVVFNPTRDSHPISGETPSLPVNLNAFYNNRAFGLTPNDGNLDGSGSMSPAFTQGYAVAIESRSENSKTNRVQIGYIRHFDKTRNTRKTKEEDRERAKTNVRAIGCPFKMYMSKKKKNGD